MNEINEVKTGTELLMREQQQKENNILDNWRNKLHKEGESAYLMVPPLVLTLLYEKTDRLERLLKLMATAYKGRQEP